MSGKRSGVGRIRVRISSSKAEGPDAYHTESAAKLLPGGDHEVGETVTFSFDENASELELITDRLATAFKECMVQRESLLIDVAFDFEGNARAELIIAVALANVADSITELKALVLLFDEMPGSRQEIPRRVAARAELSKRTLLCSLSDEEAIRPARASWDVDRFIEKVRYTLADYQDIAIGKVVRRRGVFQSPFDQRSFGFWYSAASAEDELRYLFTAYLREHGIDCVIYDSQSEEWLVALLEDVCAAGPSLNSSDALGRVEDHLSLDGKRVAVIGPMLRTGTVFRRIFSEIRELTTDVRFLAIMADESRVDGESFYYSTKSFAIDGAGAAVDIDYFVPVSHDVISDRDWRIVMAMQATPVEVQDPSDYWAEPSRTAMWSLMNSLPIGVEDPAPVHRRSAINAFPQLKDLEEADATWLAESFLRMAESQGIGRSLVIVVLPEEEPEEATSPLNGSRPLSNAFKRNLRVVTRVVSRADIEATDDPPEYLVGLIEEHPGYEVVIFDESAVSFRSLERLTAMVTKANGGKPPGLVGAVVEAVTVMHEPPADFRSLFQWQPIITAK